MATAPLVRTWNSRTSAGAAARALLPALTAAAIGYLVHHLGPLEGHPVVGVLLAIAAGGLLVSAVAVLLIPAASPPLPLVLLSGRHDVLLDPLGPRHLGFCASLHAADLPHGFFAGLGEPFLRRYYASFLDSPHAFGVVATIQGHPVGFVVGTLRVRGHTAWVLRRHGPGLVRAAALPLLRRPDVALRFARTRSGRYLSAWRRHRRQGTGTSVERRADVAVLSHVAVLEGARGCGAGSTLVRAFAAAARDAGATRVVLTTLEGLNGAGPFYRGLGWRHSATHTTADAVRMQEWSLDLDRAAGP